MFPDAATPSNVLNAKVLVEENAWSLGVEDYHVIVKLANCIGPWNLQDDK